MSTKFSQSFKLSFSEKYLGVESYTDNGIKMSILRDKKNEIESIYIQLSENNLIDLEEIFKDKKILSEVELFIPKVD